MSISLARRWMVLPLLALAPVASAFGQADAVASPPTLEEMAERLRALEEDNDRLRGEVGELRAKDEGEWLSEERATQIRQVVADVLADSEMRSSLQGAAITGGWNDGFFLAREVRPFWLRVSAVLRRARAERFFSLLPGVKLRASRSQLPIVTSPDATTAPSPL